MEIKREFAEFTAELKSIKKGMTARGETAKKKELNAIHLHERTQKALKKWRRQKDEEESSNRG